MPIKIVEDKRMDKLKHLYNMHKVYKAARRAIIECRSRFVYVCGGFKLEFDATVAAPFSEETKDEAK